MNDAPEPLHFATGYFKESIKYEVSRRSGGTRSLLIYTVSGNGKFSHPKTADLHTEPGDIILFPPHTPQHYGIIAPHHPWELLWTHFTPRIEWHALLNWPEQPNGMRQLTLNDSRIRKRVHQALLEMNRFFHTAQPNNQLFALNQLEYALLCCDRVNPKTQRQSIDGRTQKAMEYIFDHFQEPLTIENIAQATGLSPSRLSHLFKEQTQTTPINYLEDIRINHAKALLQFTPKTITEIAQEIGYSDPFYFSKRFHKHTGKSPRDYRKQTQEDD